MNDNSQSTFVDSDYLLMAYAAALKSVTAYKHLIGEDTITAENTLYVDRPKGWQHPFTEIIQTAINAAVDYLIPQRFADKASLYERKKTWAELTNSERFYVKGLDLESKGVFQNSSYLDYARGFGLANYADLVANTKANHFRLYSPTEFGRKSGGDDFGSTTLRIVMQAIEQARAKDDVEEGMRHLHSSLTNYWDKKTTVECLLEYMISCNLPSWSGDLPYISLLKDAVSADGVGIHD